MAPKFLYIPPTIVAPASYEVIAAGDSDLIYRSEDGIVFDSLELTPRPTGGWNGIAWSGSLWCMVGNDTIVTSEDGDTWDYRTPPVASIEWRDVVWNGSIFCAVSSAPSLGILRVATSPDGINWDSTILEIALKAGTHSVSLGVSGSTIIVSLGEGNPSATIPNPNRKILYTSTDGISWSDSEIYSVLTLMGSSTTIVDGSLGLLMGARKGICIFGNDPTWDLGAPFFTITNALTSVAITFNSGVYSALWTDDIITSTDGFNWDTEVGLNHSIALSGQHEYNRMKYSSNLGKYFALSNDTNSPYPAYINSKEDTTSGLPWVETELVGFSDSNPFRAAKCIGVKG